MEDLLLDQRVCSAWKVIIGRSVRIQEELSIKPSSSKICEKRFNGFLLQKLRIGIIFIRTTGALGPLVWKDPSTDLPFEYSTRCCSCLSVHSKLVQARDHSFANMLWAQGLDQDAVFDFGFTCTHCRVNTLLSGFNSGITVADIALILTSHWFCDRASPVFNWDEL